MNLKIAIIIIVLLVILGISIYILSGNNKKNNNNNNSDINNNINNNDDDDKKGKVELVYKINAGIPFKWVYEIEDESIVKFEESYQIRNDNNDEMVVHNQDYINFTRLYNEIGNYALENNQSHKYVK